MNKYLVSLLAIGFMVFSSGLSIAESIVPEAGLDAEGEKRWNDAIAIYRQYPNRDDLLQRIVDIEISLSEFDSAAKDLKKIIARQPNNPDLYIQLSEIYAQAEEPQKALDAVNAAIKVRPDNIVYQKSRSQFANWTGRYSEAESAFLKTLEHDPDNMEALLGLARVQSWQGKLDRSAKNFEIYLGKKPNEAGALLDYARVQSWRGNNAHALKVMERYAKASMASKEVYLESRARFLARADHPDESLALVADPLSHNNRNFQALFTKTIAEREAMRLENARETILVLEESAPVEKEEVKDLRRFVEAGTRSNVSVYGSYADDSDSVMIKVAGIEGKHRYDWDTYAKVGVERRYLQAERGSGLETINGNNSLANTLYWIGGEKNYNSGWQVSGRLGLSDTNVDETSLYYALEPKYRVSDKLKLYGNFWHDFHAVSARAVSLDVERAGNRLGMNWSPNMKTFIDAEAGYDFYSDDNEMWEVLVAPRHQVVRNEWLNMDLGLSARVTGFSSDLNNGYYDPDWYQQYLLTGFFYFKFNDDDGLSVTLGSGVQRDDDMNSFKFSGNASAELTLGLYQDWMFKAHVGLMDNIGVNSISYTRQEVGARLTRRF